MIYLRELCKNDIYKINRWRNEKDIIDMLGANFRYINIETDEDWFYSYQKNRGTQIRCAICIKDTGELIGLVSLTNIDYLNGSGEFHIMIGERNQHGKGYGTLSTKLMLEHAFKNLNLNRVYLSVLEENKIAFCMYEKVGFVKEGLIRKAVYKNGEYKNCYIMSILREEYGKA